MSALLTDPALRLWAICALVLVLKMFLTSGWTSVLRIRRRIYATPEDYGFQGLAPGGTPDAEIERVRRAHRNDLENVIPFLLVGFLFAASGPSLLAARIGLVGFTVARILHTAFYLGSLQPWRTIVFVVGMVLQFWMLLTALAWVLGGV